MPTGHIHIRCTKNVFMRAPSTSEAGVLKVSVAVITLLLTVAVDTELVMIAPGALKLSEELA
jgi:hypothetical protein